ncbi:uncharacterized protein LOC134615356 [Pelobates fuscus]|uniref:uncharacterized protein LOC134615356 n=1 Tax=Pelobates fuscus TaxID=191477 RepID=UPI002FE45389
METMKLQADERSSHRVVYESLCLIQKKQTQFNIFFDYIFQECFLKLFPDLKNIFQQFNTDPMLVDKYKTPTYTVDERLKKTFQQKKVAISLTISQKFPFLNGLQDLDFLSERESLTLQADERTIHRVVYESLCLIEKKETRFETFFDYIHQECFLKLFPELQNILQENKRDWMPLEANCSRIEIFQHKKVAISLAITQQFPFLHGLQDLGFLSEHELLLLQADKRSIHHVVYESLCWIEKKKNYIDTFFDYIFQKCFLDLYCKLNDISQQIKAQDDPVNKCPANVIELEQILSREKIRFSNVIKERFPFMNGLQDRGILTELELLELQADESTTMTVVHKTLSLIEKKKDLIPYFFAYLSQDIYLEKFPKLKNILQSQLQNDTTEQRLGNRISKEPDIDESGVNGVLPGIDQGQDYRGDAERKSATNSSQIPRCPQNSTSNNLSEESDIQQFIEKFNLSLFPGSVQASYAPEFEDLLES